MSGDEAALVRFLAREGERLGLGVDLWQATEGEIEALWRGEWSRRGLGEGGVPAHKPLAGRPTLVLKLAGRGTGPSLMFNAHSDVVSAPNPELWRHDPWAGVLENGQVYGRGACDTKGPLVAALWAMAALAREHPGGLDGDVMLEIVPGEEDCVGLGTMSSVARGYRADASVILEPTTNLPRCASRAGCRFTITATGRSVHGTVKWLGVDAIAIAHAAMAVVSAMETRWNDRTADGLFAAYPIARPMTIDTIKGGEWQGMVADRCTFGGYLELLPRDDWRERRGAFVRELRGGLAGVGIDPQSVTVEFTEQYAGHRLSPAGEPLCDLASRVYEFHTGRAFGSWGAFNSGCESGIRPGLHATPTVVFGPGDLAHAHAIDEHVAIADVGLAAEMFGSLAVGWCNSGRAAASESCPVSPSKKESA
ncbi:MAG: M20/M25/M40 family metallo-hydrolase [Planctomycetota bacterium]